MLPLHGRPTASVTRRARMQKPTQPMRLQSPGTRAILASQRVASEASRLAAAQTFSLETSRPTPPMLGARRAPVPAHAAASGTHAIIRNRWDGICVVAMRGGCCGAAKWNDLFGFFVRDTRGQRSKAFGCCNALRTSLMSPTRFRRSHGPLRARIGSYAAGQGFWHTLPHVDCAKQAGRPPNPRNNPFLPVEGGFGRWRKWHESLLAQSEQAIPLLHVQTNRRTPLRSRVGRPIRFGGNCESR